MHDVATATASIAGDTAVDRILLKPEVRHIVGWSDTTLWRECRAGRFPTAVQISAGRIGWLESEVREWVRLRAAARSSRA